MKHNRYSNALFIQEGACNPSAIVNALSEALTEARIDPKFNGTDFLCNDPAIRLMVHQLAFLCKVSSFEEYDYPLLVKQCEERKNQKS